MQLLKLGPYRQKSYWRTFVIRDDLNYKEQASFFIFVFLASGHVHEASWRASLGPCLTYNSPSAFPLRVRPLAWKTQKKINCACSVE